MTASIGVSVKYKPNKAFKRQLLNSSGVMSYVNEVTAPIARRAAGMFDASDYVMKPAQAGKERCHALVVTGDVHAMRSNALHNTLLKALGG